MASHKHKARTTQQRGRQTTQARMLQVLGVLDGLISAGAARGDPTFIHNFRVASRRAHEVLHVGMLALAPSQRKALRHMVKKLKELRRAAGRVRDLDVLAENLTKLPTAQEPTHMTGHDAGRKRAIQRLCKNIYSFAADGRLKQVAGQIRQLPESHLIAKLNTRIERNHQSFSTLATTALAKPTDRHTHKLRIAGKRLRYALELLPLAYRPTHSGPAGAQNSPGHAGTTPRSGNTSRASASPETHHALGQSRPSAKTVETDAAQDG